MSMSATARIAVLGGGHGVAAVLGALRDAPADLTAVVSTADDGGSSGDLRRRFGGPAVGDIRRSLIALSDQGSTLATAMSRPVSTEFGRHPVGNLLIRSLADGLGDLEASSRRVGQWLGISGCVLPASVEPVSLVAETSDGLIAGESAIGATHKRIRRLHFEPGSPDTPDAALHAILTADWVLLAPGSLYTSTLATSGLPAVASAIADTPARVLWLCNLEPGVSETADLTAEDHLAALRRHGVRVDYVLYDPGSELHFSPVTLARNRVAGFARPLRAGRRAVHDVRLLGVALESLLGAQTVATGTASAEG